MNKFEKQLEKWNGGVLRGAQAKLAKILKVSTATVALWTTGKRHPSKGYAEQMASLFGLDVYAVTRLFEAPARVAYPDRPLLSPARTLRDGEACPPGYAARPVLPAQSNSAALPLLADVPPSGRADYEDGDVLEWWTLPRLRAQGAKYFITLPGRPGRLLAIKPGGWEPGRAHLVRTAQGLTEAHARLQDGRIWLEREGVKRPAGADERPEGVITLVIHTNPS